MAASGAQVSFGPHTAVRSSSISAAAVARPKPPARAGRPELARSARPTAKTVRLRALLPGGPVKVRGREDVATTRWVCTQTAVCKVVDGRLAVIDLLCSGFREIETMTTCPRHPALDSWGDFDRDDPFPLFAQVRSAAPVHEVRLADGHPAWLVVGHEQARAALNDPRLSKDMHAALARSGEVVAEGLPGPALARHMLSVDPPDHTRLRRLAMPAFSRRRVAALEARVRSIVERAARRAGGPRRHRPGRRPGGGLRVPAAVHRDQRAARDPGAGPGRPRPVVPHPARPLRRARSRRPRRWRRRR